MLTIWKYPLELTDSTQQIAMPKGAKILTVQMNDTKICIWALVDSDAETDYRDFKIYGTGHAIYQSIEDLAYVGTVQMGLLGPLGKSILVWHVFELPTFHKEPTTEGQ